MHSMVDIYYLPSTAPASAPTNATDYQTSERSAPQAGGRRYSIASQTSERGVRQTRGRRCSIISQGPPSTSIAVADPTSIPIVVKQNGRTEVTTCPSRYSSSPPPSLSHVVKILERRDSRRRSQKPEESPLSSSDEGEGFSGSDTTSEAGSA